MFNVHDLFKKKELRDRFPADKIYEIDRALLLFSFFSFIPLTIVGNFIMFVYLFNPKSNYKLPCRQTFERHLRSIKRVDG